MNKSKVMVMICSCLLFFVSCGVKKEEEVIKKSIIQSEEKPKSNVGENDKKESNSNGSLGGNNLVDLLNPTETPSSPGSSEISSIYQFKAGDEIKFKSLVDNVCTLQVLNGKKIQKIINFTATINKRVQIGKVALEDGDCKCEAMLELERKQPQWSGKGRFSAEVFLRSDDGEAARVGEDATLFSNICDIKIRTYEVAIEGNLA
jgi:hypothetical protein